MTPQQFIDKLGERYYAYIKNGELVRIEKRFAMSETRNTEWIEVPVTSDFESLLSRLPTIL